MAYQSVDLKSNEDIFESSQSTLFARPSKSKLLLVILAVCLLGVAFWHVSTAPAETFGLAQRVISRNVDDTSICKEPTYSQTTLKTVEESSMISLFRDVQANTKFEASDVVQVKDAYFVVYDNLYAIGRISTDMPFRSQNNVLLGNRSGESGYEAIVYDDVEKRFYVVVEAVEHADNKFHAIVEEIEMIDRTEEPATHVTKADVSFRPVEDCPCEMSFATENKGFEGAVMIRVGDNLFLLGLCEGNYCDAGKKGREAGHGRLIIMKKVAATRENKCYWKTVQILDLPETVSFVDYSAITARRTGRPHEFRLAVSSQESAAVWIGNLTVSDDSHAEGWKISRGKIYDFPRDSECRVVYCNVEGLSFISDNMLVAVSDQMKVDGRQPFRCLDKDQSIHVFVIPQPEPTSIYYNPKED